MLQGDLMRSESTANDDPQFQLEKLKSGIREITHEINNPLGVLRMASYFLESTDPDAETRARYAKMMNESLDRIEQILNRLSFLRENPSASVNAKEKTGLMS